MDPGRAKGFSLVELLVSLSVTLSVGAAVFHVFLQQQRAFRDQDLVLEMQQSVRAVASMIADEVRMAGQGAPLFAATYEAGPSEAPQAFLAGTDRLELRMRLAVPAETAVDGVPLAFETGRPTSVRLLDPGRIFDPGSHVFFWGPSGDTWTWVRARVEASDLQSGLTVTPAQVSTEGGRFTSAPSVSAEDGISYRLSGRSVLRGELRDLSALTAPVFLESSVGEDFTALRFDYYDAADVAVDPASPAARNAIRRVAFRLGAETSEALSDGRRRTYEVTMSVHPRNPQVQ